MNLGSKHASSRLLTVFSISLAILFFCLGLWQWQRAEEKALLLESAKTPAVLYPGLAALSTTASRLDYQHVKLRGQYLPTQSFFLLNQFEMHRLGVHVLTPFVTEEGAIILVDRGWTQDRRPAVLEASSETQVILGRLRVIPKPHFVSAAPKHPGKGALQLIQVDQAYLERIWGQVLMPYMLLLDPDQKEGYSRKWIVSVITPERHRAYAIQWFALSLLSIIMLAVFLNNRGKS